MPVDDPLDRFTGLYDRYYRNVLRYALQHAEPGSAEDVASETFLVAWRKLRDVPDPPLPWLLGVARNLLRKQAVAALPERDTEVLTLVTWHGLDPREAAAVLGCSPRAFTAALHRARKRLARALSAAQRAESARPARLQVAGRPATSYISEESA
jgi:DNA-directed RNA polymerase specialized sigma24 family protein